MWAKAHWTGYYFNPSLKAGVIEETRVRALALTNYYSFPKVQM
jgi:hypothetical protein